MAFQIALADPATNNSMLASTIYTLSPAPARVSYPSEPMGQRLETPDGRLILQQPSKDNRVRTWFWDNYPGFLITYERQYQYLSSLRSRYRQDGTRQSPFVYIKDSTTKRLRRRVTEIRTLASSGSTASTLTDSVGGMTVNLYTDAVVEILDSGAGGTGTGAYQRAVVVSNTATVMTLATALSTIPHGAKILITYWVDDWFRARVIDVGRDLRDEGGNVRYKETRFAFVIDDAAFNDLG